MSVSHSERSNPGGLTQKDRLLAFAFAASDLLVEVSGDGAIGFAAGAFKARFGTAPEEMVGRRINRLFAPEDRAAVDLALSTTMMRGRLTPLVLRLADAEGTPMVLSGLSMPSEPGRLCFTIGRVPALPGAVEPGGPPATTFARLAEASLQNGEGGALGLVELPGLASARAAMPADAQRALHAEIVDVLGRVAGPGGVAGEIGSGRYGVLAETPPQLEALAVELETLFRANPATAGTHVQSTNLTLDRDGLTGVQAARALRFALARFADGGLRATEDAGFAHGLAEFVASAQLRARSIRSALAENRFHLAFQPVVHLDTRAVHHYEALLRPILTPGSTIRTTQDFVTFAEAVGLSEELDWAVMQQAVAALEASPTALIAVNVSGLSMQSAGFAERAMTLLAEQAPPGRILIELTETADIENVAEACATIDRLRAMQIPVCIDDFGAGSAAFRYLREFRFDYVKLDGAYVRGALNSAREHGFLLSMIELANFVGARVIAETVEQEAEAQMMRELGVEYGQGWLFGKPGALPGSLPG